MICDRLRDRPGHRFVNTVIHCIGTLGIRTKCYTTALDAHSASAFSFSNGRGGISWNYRRGSLRCWSTLTEKGRSFIVGHRVGDNLSRANSVRSGQVPSRGHY